MSIPKFPIFEKLIADLKYWHTCAPNLNISGESDTFKQGKKLRGFKLKYFSLFLFCTIFLSGCSVSVPGLTSATNIPLELKGFKTGQEFKECPNKEVQERFGRVLLCSINVGSIGDVEVKSAAITTLDNYIVMVRFELSQASGFSQTGLLNALSKKFGPPARGGKPKTHIWTNKSDTLYLEEIQGRLTLHSSKLFEAQKELNDKRVSDL